MMKMRAAASSMATLAVLLAACTPTPAPPAPAAGSAGGAAGATVMVNGRPVPADMMTVPPDPITFYKRLEGEGETPQDGGKIIRHLESECNSLNPVLQTELYEAYVENYLF